MANEIKSIPEFSQEAVETQEIKETADDAVGKKGEETLDSSQEEKENSVEPPSTIQPVSEHADEDITAKEVLQQSIQGLESERIKLLRELAELRGQRREIKQEQVSKVEQQLDELKDLNPDDVAVVEKILRSKGYVPKEEIHKMFYDSVKTEEVNRFLEAFPEYKPENDSGDVKWSTLQKELGYYRMPDNPRLIGEVLRKAHQAIVGTFVRNETDIATRQKAISLAGVGSGGIQRSSPRSKTLDPEKRVMLSQGGWSEEEIKKIESNL